MFRRVARISREGEIGDRGVEDAWRVRDGDARAAALLDVYEVVADAVVRDETEVGEELELSGSDAGDRDGEDVDACLRLRWWPRIDDTRLRARPAGPGNACVAAILTRASISALRRLAAVPTIVIPVRRCRGARRACTSRPRCAMRLPRRCSRTCSQPCRPVGPTLVADRVRDKGAAVAAALSRRRRAGRASSTPMSRASFPRTSVSLPRRRRRSSPPPTERRTP
jgi:hypothetical protein